MTGTSALGMARTRFATFVRRLWTAAFNLDRRLAPAIDRLMLPWPDRPARCLAWNVLLFAIFCLVFYGLAPEFLLQNHDGQNLYYMAEGIFRWRVSWLESVTFSPLQGMASTFWPLNPTFIPFLWPFAALEDPAWRVYGVMVLAALTIFIAALAFFVSLRLRPRLAIGASWLTYVVFLLQTPDFLTGIDPLISIAATYMCLAVLVESGRHGASANAAWFIAYQLCFTIIILAHPSWHVIGLPLFGAIALAIVAGAERRSEAIVKIGAIAVGFASHWALGTYEALYYLVSDTARVLRADAFQPLAQVPYLAGHLFRTGTTDLLWGIFLFVGLGAGGLAAASGRPRLARMTTTMAVAVYVMAVVGALWFLYSGRPWIGPKPSYMLLYVYPLSALFAALGISACWQWLRARHWQTAAIAPYRLGLVVLAIAGLLAWHLFNARIDLTRVTLVVIVAVGIVALLRSRLPRLAAVVAVGITYFALHASAVEYAGHRGDSVEGSTRMGIKPNPVIAFLARDVGLRPDAAFRGYADDAYSQRPGERNLIQALITQWAGNWQLYGHGMKLFNWNASAIPTLTAYSPYIKPLYFTLFTRLLNAPNDLHTVNYLTISRPNIRILQLLGLRYLVTDTEAAPAPEARLVMQWEKFRVYELPNPNLASYSPVTASLVENADAVVARLADAAFDPTREALVTETPVSEGLVAAPPARLVFQRGGFHVEATSPGRSLIVLPVEYSHCLVAEVVSGDRSARLIRANLVQTGLLFESAVGVTVRWRYWPLARPTCGRLDYEESVRLLRLNAATSPISR